MPNEEHVRIPGATLGAMALAVVVFVAVVLVGLMTVSGIGFRPQSLLATTYFTDAAGLKSGAAVNLDGVTIGTVKSVTLATAPERKNAPVQVTMKLKRKYLYQVHNDSIATILSLGALGDTSIDIDSRQAVGPVLSDGAVLPSIATPGMLDQKALQTTIANAQLTVAKLNAAVDQIQSGKGTMGLLLNNPALVNEAKDTIGTAQQVAAKLDQTTNSVGKLIKDRSVTDKFSSIAANVQGVSASMGRLTGGPLQANLATAQTETNALADDVNAGSGAVGMLLKKDSPLSQQVVDTSKNLNALVAGIDAGKGTAGKIADGKLQVDLGKLEAESTALAAMIRKNPTKYLTIKVRLF